jgi:hypothetical protein
MHVCTDSELTNLSGSFRNRAAGVLAFPAGEIAEALFLGPRVRAVFVILGNVEELVALN